MLQFIQEHSSAFIGFGIALADFAIALAPGLKSNGLFHMIYLAMGGKES